MTARKQLSSASRGFAKFFGRLIRGMGWLWILLSLAVILGAWGVFLQKASTPKSEFPSEAISVTVYVSVSPARVSLSLYAYLQPQYDTLHVNVTGPNAQSDPWILVVQCPNGARHSSEFPVYTEGTSGIQPVQNEIVSNHDHKNYSQSLGCFKVPKLPAETVTSQDIDVSLPVLEQNQAAQSAQAATPLYVERSKAGKKDIQALVEVLQPPDSSCQTTGPGPDQAPPLSLLGASGPPVTSPLRDFYSLPSAITTPCFTPLYPNSTDTQYYFPASVTTSETLENVSLAQDSVSSLFPPGQITSSDKVEWQGTPDAALSPSLSATSLSSAQSASTDLFIAGLLIGAAAGFFAPFVQGIPEPWKQAWRATRFHWRRKGRLQVEVRYNRNADKWTYHVPALDISGDAAPLEASLRGYCADMTRALGRDSSAVEPPVATPDASAAPSADGAQAGPTRLG